MPAASTSESDPHRVDAILTVLNKGLTRQDLTGDELYQAFQEIDPETRGFVASKSAIIDVLCDVLTPKYQRRVDFEALVGAFKSKKHGRFDYAAFCKAFDRHRAVVEASIPQAKTPRPQSPSKRPMSPTKRSMAPTSTGGAEHSDVDITKLTVRADPRLETQRLLLQSIRKKLLQGIIGARYGGFLGIQETLFHLDERGEGYVGERSFEEHVLARLRRPLTKQESQFLRAHIRILGSKDNDSDAVIDYEQIATLCNLDSDASADETEDDGNQRVGDTPDASTTDGSHLGADFLATEKNLRLFLQQPHGGRQVGTDDRPDQNETPRSAITGAEHFLELAEVVDRHKTGCLQEHEIQRILSACGIELSLSMLRSLLSRFTRSQDGSVNYLALLERYGQNPHRTRERRQLKRVIASWLIRLHVPVETWLEFLTGRFQRLDLRRHGRIRGEVSAEEFVQTLQRTRREMLTLTVEDATAAVGLFLRVSTLRSTTSVLYGEFLRLVRDCHLQSLATTPSSPTRQQQPPPPSPLSPKANATVAAEPITDVAGYLIHRATDTERQHFEELMDLLHAFQRRISRLRQQQNAAAETATTTTTRTTGPTVSRPTRAASIASPAATASAAAAAAATTTTSTAASADAGTLQPIPNGIRVALGPHLGVRIQFTTSPNA